MLANTVSDKAPTPLAGATLSLETHGQSAPVLAAWAELEANAPASLYQTRRFVIPWQHTMGAAGGVRGHFTVLRHAGAPVALFAFGIVERGGLRRLEFLGGRDSNANLGLFHPDYDFVGIDFGALLREAARAGKADAIVLANQPERWEDFDNPLARLPSQPSPSYGHSTLLMADSEAFARLRLSADTRKKMRAKRRKLEERGPVALLTARTAEEAGRILEAFFTQKRARFDEKNISNGFDSVEARAFFARCCVSRIGRRDASVELHALTVGDDIAATYGGGVHAGRFHGMLNSFDARFARSSPADLLLGLLIEAKCRQGLRAFDLGVGESRYKDAWCDREEPMFDTLIGLTAKGRAFAAGEAVRRSLKRTIKQSEWAWPLAQRLRARMRLR